MSRNCCSKSIQKAPPRKTITATCRLHYAAHYNAPLEVVEALYHAYPEGALQKNNDNNTPLDLAIADGASPNVVALLQGQSVPPTDDEVLESAKARCERMEKELQRQMEQHDGMNEDRELVLAMLLDIYEKHPHALYAAGIDPHAVNDMNSLLEQVRACVRCFCCCNVVEIRRGELRSNTNDISYVFFFRSERQPWTRLQPQVSATKKSRHRLSKTPFVHLTIPSKSSCRA